MSNRNEFIFSSVDVLLMCELQLEFNDACLTDRDIVTNNVILRV